MLHEIIELLGHDAATRLVMAFCGREIRVPVRHKGRTWEALVQAIGEQDASRFCDYFRGERLYIAGSQKLTAEFNRRRAAEMRAQGKSWSEIAKALQRPSGYTERGARKLLERIGTAMLVSTPFDDQPE